MSIFDNEIYLNPKYNHLEKYVNVIYKGFWTPAKYEKLIKETDTPHYHNNMGDIDKEAIRRCIMAVNIVEDRIKSYWNVLHTDLPQTIISDIGSLFGMTETTHRRSYHALADEIGIDMSEVEQHDILRDRVKYLNKHLEKDPKIVGKKRVLKNLVLFTSLVERASLFTQFYILMSYAKRNRGLKTISALQQSTATEEVIHYSFGIDVINIIKEEHPHLWEDYLVDLIGKNIRDAYNTELKLIDWFFEKGVPEHLTKEEVVNFLNYNFRIIAKDLGINMRFKVDDKMYEDKNSWMLLKMYSSDPDFFDNSPGAYSSTDEEVNINNFKF